MTLVEHWDTPADEWARYVLEIWKPNIGRVQQMEGEHPTRLAFWACARSHLASHGFPTARVRTWCNVMHPDEQTGYDKGYPHVHHDTEAVTVVHYLDVGDKPPALDLFSDEGKTISETLVPQTGQAIYIPNGVWHGVHRNNGTRPRVALIATGYPR